jgi:uncharacterized protein (DUF433 family)
MAKQRPLVEAIPLKHWDDGSIRIGETRVTLETFMSRFDAGDTPDDIVEGFPTISLDNVYAVITYYLRHQEEVREYLERREEKARAVRAKYEALYPTDDLRRRLRERKPSVD